jgi:nitroreductase
VTRRQLLLATAAALAIRPARAAAPSPCLDGVLDRRRMVRRFTKAPVDDAVIEQLLATAVRAPSAGDTQPWAFVVVRDAAARRRLAKAALDQRFVAEAPVVIAACAAPRRARGRYGERATRYALIDTAFASLLLMLDVAERGLGACFVGAFDDAAVRRLLNLPPDVQPLALILVGHPAERPKGRRRRPLGEVVHRERWRDAQP